MSRRCSLYINRCVTVSSSEDIGVPGETVPFTLDPILLDLEGGNYVGTLLPLPLAELVSEIRDGGGNNGGSGGTNGGGSRNKNTKK